MMLRFIGPPDTDGTYVPAFPAKQGSGAQPHLFNGANLTDVDLSSASWHPDTTNFNGAIGLPEHLSET